MLRLWPHTVNSGRLPRWAVLAVILASLVDSGLSETQKKVNFGIRVSHPARKQAARTRWFRAQSDRVPHSQRRTKCEEEGPCKGEQTSNGAPSHCDERAGMLEIDPNCWPKCVSSECFATVYAGNEARAAPKPSRHTRSLAREGATVRHNAHPRSWSRERWTLSERSGSWSAHVSRCPRASAPAPVVPGAGQPPAQWLMQHVAHYAMQDRAHRYKA